MFNKYSIKGKYSNIKIYKTFIENIENFDENNKEDLLFDKNYIFLNGLKINIDENQLQDIELSGNNSYKNKKEKKEDKNPKYYEEDLFMDLLKDDGCYLIDIDNYDYNSPNFKTLFSNFELGLLTFKLIPFEYITEGLVEGYLISEIEYDSQKIDIEKKGFLFKEYMNIKNKKNDKILIEIRKESVYILDHTID